MRWVGVGAGIPLAFGVANAEISQPVKALLLLTVGVGMGTVIWWWERRQQ